ncbi:hypothetical protein G9C85_02600 [Halorubellus sp. JP-L1]|nr:hypothetical protein [Halorubellus sp. JP-L1]
MASTQRQVTQDVVDQIARSFTLGTDAEGYTHHYYRPADAVVVFDGRELDHVEHLDGRRLEAWERYIEGKRGWRSHGPHSEIGISEDDRRKRNGGDD